MTGSSITSIPCPATCSQMAYELGLLSTIQIIEFMISQKSLCLSWDATTIEGAHINEIHLTANKTQCLILDVRHLPGGTSSDYVTHIMGSLSEAASTYAKFKGCMENEIFVTLKSKISSTLSDRAAVNGAVTRQLCFEMDSELLRLNCNVHPLDSVAREIKGVCRRLDSELDIHGECFGSEGAAANLIKAISVLRYKDGKGDPVGFKNFLHQNDIPVGAFPRYVGNRMHVLFHLAGVLILHEAHLIEFLEKQCTAAGQLRSRIMKDLKHRKILIQVWVLAAIGKTFSGPWMAKFYSSTMSNLETGPHIQCCLSKLKNWIEDPHSFTCLHDNVFLEKLDPSKDAVLSALMEFEIAETSLLIDFSKSFLTSVLTVLSRQLNDFVDGQYTQPSTDMMELAASAPTHNMASERTLGSFDRMYRRAPNATMGFLNGKVKTKFNKTMGWFENKSDEEKKDLINFISTEAHQERCRKLIEFKDLEKEISKRRNDVANQRERSKRKSIIRDLNKTFNKLQSLNPSYSDHAEKHILDFISSPESVIGLLFLHILEDCHKYGRIHKLKKNNKLVVGYWNLDEIESNSSDTSISASSFYADLVLGHVILM